MSLMVDEKGCAKTYVIVDERKQTLVAGCNSLDDEKASRLIGGHRTVYKPESPKCPDWAKALLMADPEYCAAKAVECQRDADSLRLKAASILEEADQMQSRADYFARASEAANKGDPNVDSASSPR